MQYRMKLHPVLLISDIAMIRELLMQIDFMKFGEIFYNHNIQ